MDDFFRKKHCDRCGADLTNGRIMSMYNEDCICLACKEKERQRPDYTEACIAEAEQIKQGNLTYKGIGYEEDNKMGGRGGGSGRGGGANQKPFKEGDKVDYRGERLTVVGMVDGRVRVEWSDGDRANVLPDDLRKSTSIHYQDDEEVSHGRTRRW